MARQMRGEVLGALALANTEGAPQRYVSELADELLVPERHVRLALAELVPAGLVDATRGVRKVNYTITPVGLEAARGAA